MKATIIKLILAMTFLLQGCDVGEGPSSMPQAIRTQSCDDGVSTCVTVDVSVFEKRSYNRAQHS